MSQYIAVQTSTGRIEFKFGAMGKPDPAGYIGPLNGPMPPFPTSNVVWMPWQGKIEMSAAPTPTSQYMWTDAGPAWVEMASAGIAIEYVIERIDAEADAARMSVLVKTTKSKEYMQAEAQAREWKAAGYAGKAPIDVASWAAAKHRDGMTEQQAAESILAQADQYRALLSGIRALRLLHMENARHAVDAAGAQAAAAAFSADLTHIMKGTA